MQTCAQGTAGRARGGGVGWDEGWPYCVVTRLSAALLRGNTNQDRSTRGQDLENFFCNP